MTGRFTNPILQNIENKRLVEVNRTPFILGRGLESDYMAAENVVSRLHCKLEKTDDGWVLRDMSTNGTMVNDALYKGVVSSVLKHNDYICLGNRSCTYKFLLETEKVPNMPQVDFEYGSVLTPREFISEPIMALDHLNSLPVNDSEQNHTSITSVHDYAHFPCDGVLEHVPPLPFGPDMCTSTSSPYLTDEPNYEHDNSKNNDQDLSLLVQTVNTDNQKIDNLANQDVENVALISRNNVNETNELNSNQQISGSSRGELPGTSGIDLFSNLHLPSAVPMPSTSYTSNTVMNVQSTKRSETSASLESHASKKMKLSVRCNNLTRVNSATGIQDDIVDLTNSDGLSDDESTKAASRPAVIVKTSSSATENNESVKEVHDSATSLKCVSTPGPSKTVEDIENTRQQDYAKMENELMCTICSNLFIKAVTLACSHTFCEYCINFWRKKKSNCPICRAVIKSKIRTLVLDNVIEKMMENAPAEEIKQRKDAIAEREQIEAAQKTKSKGRTVSRRGNGRTYRSYRTFRRVVPPPPSPPQLYPMQFSVYSNDVSPDLSEDSDDGVDYPSEWFDRDVHAGYFGEGSCTTCGTPGHWTNRCPYRVPGT